MIKGKKLEGYEQAVIHCRKQINEHRKNAYADLLIAFENTDPTLLAKILNYLIENPRTRREISEAGDAFGILRFIKTNVGEEVDTLSLVI